MGADRIVRTAITSVPKAVAAGVVDLESGLMLSIKTVESHPQKILDLLAPAARDLFEGEMITTIENMFKQARGVQSTERYFQEVIISSTNLWHYFGRLKKDPRTVLCVVATADSSVALLLLKCREITAIATP
jgi:hypothetical protein